MRIVASVAFGLCLAAGAALAASPEDDYVAARDRAIAAIKRLEGANAAADKLTAAQDKARTDLEKRLDAILGPFAIAGFPAAGKLNLESLSASAIGFGMLDGLVHGEGEAGPRVVVTTRGLVERWLKAKAADKEANVKLPADLGAALALDLFTTEAIGSDAAFSRTADLAVKKPDGADFVVSRLGGWAQDIGPNPSQQIIVALGKGGKVFIAESRPKTPIPKIAACEAVWSAATKASEKLQKAYQDSGLKDEKLFNQSTAAQEKGDKDYRACVGERLAREPIFPALVKEAQDIVDRLASQ